jgi:heat-inducible transcriptional repressor
MKRMTQFELSERERLILAVLIDHYIRTAEPVGSRVIATKYSLGVSPATVRNTLSDLEEKGLIEQPHTSAGRIPTEGGYRLYVDRLLKSERLSANEKEQIKRALSADFNAIEDILEQTSRVLAKLTSQLGVTISPKFDQAVLNKIDLVQLTDTRVMVIIAVRSGIVRTILIEVESNIEVDHLRQTADILNEKLTGLSLGEIRRTIGERLRDQGKGDPQLLKLFIEQHEHLLSDSTAEGLHTDGTVNILAQKEFRNPEKLREFLTLLEERRSLIDLLKVKTFADEITVTIGAESNIEGMKGCSAVTRSYQAGQIRGTVGIIGPTRMEYAKLMSVVDFTAKVLSEILSR